MKTNKLDLVNDAVAQASELLEEIQTCFNRDLLMADQLGSRIYRRAALIMGVARKLGVYQHTLARYGRLIPMSPGEFLQFTYMNLGHVGEVTMYQIENRGLQGLLDDSLIVDEDVSEKLEELTGRSAASWIQMQKNYDKFKNSRDKLR